MRPIGVPHNQRLKLTGAAILVFQASTSFEVAPEASMADKLAEAVKKAAEAGDVAALQQLAATHGGPAIRLDGNPAELTALHWAAASGRVEAGGNPATSTGM